MENTIPHNAMPIINDTKMDRCISLERILSRSHPVTTFNSNRLQSQHEKTLSSYLALLNRLGIPDHAIHLSLYEIDIINSLMAVRTR
jgi:hypothetical protein